MDPSKNCPVCDKRPRLLYRNHPGYRQVETYDIMHCAACNTSYALPLGVNSALYDVIYGNARNVPGYDRYEKRASEVLLADSPLEYLASVEDAYWAIRECIHGLVNGKEKKIIEIGCGLGYLTYSVAREGYSIVGFDVSAKAIEAATEKYGNYFMAGDVVEHSRKIGEHYDVAIMAEIIEHVPNVRELLESVGALLVPGGEMILTTPNKSAYNEKMLWDTDLPPVHLYWFSETSITALAKSMGYSVRFVDFTEYNRLYPDDVNNRIWFDVPVRQSIFDADGKVVSNGGMPPGLKAKKAGAIDRMLAKFGKQQESRNSRRKTLCAVLTKPIPA
jgi:SAM-dependent methyltransferase